MSKKHIDQQHHTTFDGIRHQDESGHEYWRARQLAKVLEYSEYRHFLPVITRAKAACRNSGQNEADHFEDILDMVDIGSGAQRPVEDVRLSRYACYLIVQNGDPSKPVIANGQTYFALQTRRQELADEANFSSLSEAEKRLAIRNELATHNKQLAAAARDAGVETALDYAIFQDHGYKGLYGGLGAKDIHTTKGLKKSQKILDHMGSTELAANLFRATQTEEKLRRDGVQGRRQANQTHHEVGSKVRQTIWDLGGTMPEKPMASVKDLTRFGVDLSDARHIAPEDFENLAKQGCRPQVGDVLIAKDGNSALDTVCTVDKPLDAVLLSSVAILRPNPDVLDSNFLKFYLSSPDTVAYLKSNFISGAAIPRVVLRDFKRAEILLPNLEAQKRISAVLQTIDDKIDLNRRINQTLEAMAQAIFKSWFVDFDPVKARIAAIEQGEDPLRAAMRAISGKTNAELDQMPREQHDQLAATAALFPDAMEESEQGEIPKGWEEKSLDQIAIYLNGLALQKFPPESEDEYLPVIKIAQLRAGHASGADRASKNIKPEYIVRDGDVLFSWSGSLEVDVWTGGAGALNQHLFKVTSENVPKWFYYFATKHYLLHFREIAANKATTMGHIQRKHLSDAKIAIPPAGVIKAATEIIDPTFRQMITTRLQSNQLVHLRDTLLPKLLSGELSINPMQEANDD